MMLRFGIVLMVIAITPTLISSQNIIVYKNASEYIEGAPAEISCHFPAEFTVPLVWDTVAKSLPSKLRCRENNETCDEYAGYQLSRINNNLTLVIDHVDLSARKWECSTMDERFSKFVTLDIRANPPLGLTLKKDGRKFELSSSCSTFEMNVTCQLDSETLEIKELQSKSCQNAFMFHLYGVVKPSHSGTILCTAFSKDQKASVEYRMILIYMYIIGGILELIGIIIFIVAIVKNYLHGICLGIFFILLGLAFLLYNSSFAAFVVLLVIAVIFLLLTILHFFFGNQKTICSQKASCEL